MRKRLFALIHNKIKDIKYFLVFPVLLLLMIYSSGLKAQNNAVALDGNGDIISIPNNTNWDFGSQDFTISFWVKFGDINKVHNGLFGRDDFQWIALEYNHDFDHRLILWIDANGSYNWELNNLKPTKNDWVNNTWYNIAVVRNGNQIQIYIDGEPDGSATYNSSVYNPSVPLYFGRSQLSNRFHEGELDDIRIFNYALSEIEINAEMYTELTGNELGLLAYWNLNETSGTTANDLSPSAINGSLINDAVFVSSTSPILPNNSTVQPFAPVDPTGLPYSFIITSVTIDGGNLPAGASIAIYDDTLCVGAAFFDYQNNTQIVTWEKDNSQGLLGFSNGHTAIFKIRLPWFSEMQIFTATASFTQGDGNFGTGTFSVASLNVNTGLSPDIVISDTLFNFNALPINTSLSDTLIITNNGNAVLNVTGISTSASVFTLSASSFLIAAGSSDTLVVTFTPDQVLAYAETLTILTDHPVLTSLQVDLYGSGLPTPSPNIIVNPGYLNFGGLAVNDTSTLSFYILNGGNGDLEITSVSSSDADFTFTGPTTLTLPQNNTEEYYVHFNPLSTGYHSGTITIASNSGNVSIPVVGNASIGNFNPVAATGLPYQVIVNSVEIDGVPLSVGDELAVFDDTTVVGMTNINSNGSALSFDGSGDYMGVTIDVSETNYTAEMWFRSNSSGGGIYSVVGGGHDRHIYLNNGNICVRTYNAGTICTSGNNYGDGQWHHVAHTFGGSVGGQKVYVDGLLQASSSKSQSDFNTQTGINIGYSADYGYFNGEIDEVRIWNIARTQAEIVSTMNSQLSSNTPGLQAYWKFDNMSLYDYSGNGYTANIYGNTSFGISGIFTGQSFNVITWEADPANGMTGFTSGDTMSFMLYANIYNSWIELNATPTYTYGDGTFGFNPYTVVDLSANSGLQPVFGISDTSIYVGQVQVSQSASDTIYIYNTGNAEMSVSLAENNSAFSLNSYSANIAAGDSAEIIITFLPGSPGNYSTSLIVTSNDPNNLETIVTIEGFALPSPQTDINVSLNSLNFNAVIIGNSKSLFFNVINNGTAPLVVSNIVSDNGNFVVSPTSFTLQNTNDNQLIEVAFTPNNKGTHEGTLTVQSNAANTNVTVSGIGIDGHFTSVQPTGNPYNIIIQSHNLNGFIEPGDEIAVFDNGLCVGVSAVQSDTGNIQLTAWESDLTNGLAGYTTGDTIEIKIWTALNGYDSELESELTFIVGDGTYGFGVFSVCSVLFNLPQITVDPGSMFVAIDEPDSTTVNLTITNNGNDDLYFNLIPPQTNFTASYYYSPGSSSSPAIGNFIFSVEDSDINENWGGGGPGNGVGNDDFQVIWTGLIFAEQAGVYNFRSYSDDGIRLYIDGQIIINHWYDMGGTNYYGSMSLSQGIHSLEFQYYENGGGALCQLYWTPPGESESLIPAANLGDWLTYSQLTDTIAPGQSSVIEVEFNSTGQIDGLYQSSIFINNNSTTNPQLAIPVSMNVTGFPQISLSSDSLFYGELIVGESDTLSYTITNIGTDSLIIDSMYMSVVNDFSFLTSFTLPIEIAPLSSVSYDVEFTPSSDGIVNDTIYLLSNASNDDTAFVFLNGTGLTPADIYLPVNSWTGTIASGNVMLDTFYIYNQGQANLVFNVNNTVPWLSLNPSIGSISVMDSLAIEMNISGIGVYAGNYSNNFDIESNDLIDPVVQFFLNLTVTGEPEITAPTSYNFGVVNVGESGQFEYVITNTGSDTLTIDSIIINNPVYSFGGSGNFYILPGETDTVPLVFIPLSAISYPAIMTIYSDATNSSVYQVAIQGTGYEPAEIIVGNSVLFTSNDLLPGNENLFISNTGGDNLIYNISTSNAGGNALMLDGNGDYLNVGNSPELNPDTALSIETWIYPQDNTQEFIVAKEYSAVGTYRLFINSSGKLQFQINNSKSVTSSTSIAINTWTHVAASTNGKVLQIFINGVLDAEVEYAPFTISTNTNNLRIGRSYFNEYFYGKMDELRIWDIYLNETEIQTLMTQHLNGDEAGLVLYYGFNNETGNIIQDNSLFNNAGTMYGNASRVSSDVPIDNFFSILPYSGNIPMSGSENVTFNFTPYGFMSNNTYSLPVYINSNDPDSPVDTVSVNMQLNVIPPDLSVSSNSVTFNDTYIGMQDTIQILVTNNYRSPININSWQLSDTDYSLEFEYPFVMPFSSKYINIIFTPSSGGAHIDTLRILNNSNTAVLEVELIANGLVPPVLSLNQLSFSDTLDFGNSGALMFWVKNNGDGPLNYNFTDIPATWLSVLPVSGTVPAHDSIQVIINFNPSLLNDGGSYQAEILLNSNDLLNPQVAVSVSMWINGAQISVSAAAISEYVTYQDMGYDTLYIVNNGIGPLSYNITEGANWLSVSPASGTIPVGAHDTIIVTYDGNFPQGNYQEDLIITCNDPITPQVTIPVTLDILHATLVTIPTSLNFGYSVVNIGDSLNLTILNNGNVNLTIDSIYCVDPFTLDPNYSVFLPPGASIVVPVHFLPNATLIFNETIYIDTDIGQFSCPVTGTGENANAGWAYSWSEFDFGLVDIAVGAVKNLTIWNTGNIPFTMDDFNNSETDHFDVSDSIFTILPGQSHTVQIFFNPVAVETYEATMLWTVNAIGTKEILLDGFGYFLSQAPTLTYVDDSYYNGTEGVYPLIGTSSEYFEYKVIYTDADNDAPMAGYPVVGIDKNGDGDFLDSGEDEFVMYEADPLDIDYTDGKLYIFSTTLPLNMDLGYSFYALDELGNIPIGEGVNYRSDPFVSNDLLDLSIFADDITFSNNTPAVGENVTIWATVHNNSDYPTSNVSVKFYEEDSFLVELFIPYIGAQSQQTVYINHVFPIDEFYPMKVVVDEQNFILEDNELNNFAIRPVLVGEFSVPGAIVSTANIAPAMILPYGTLHYWGHADYVNSYDPNADVSGALVTMTVVETGYTYTTYTNSVGDFSIYFTAPGTVGTYTVVATVTDFTLTGEMPVRYFTVYLPTEEIFGPDLAITYWWGTDIHWTSECRKIGDPIEVTAIVTNIGNMTAYNALVHVFQDGNLILTPVYDSIPAGTNKVITFWVTYNTVGYHSVSVDIDPFDMIAELAEWNNYGQKTRWIYPLEPDLSPTYIWFSDYYPLQGQAMNMTFRVNNLECETTGATNADIYHIYGNDTTFLANLPIDPINGLSYDYLYLYNQSFDSLGWNYIMIVVDPQDLVVETNELNNVLIAGFFVEEAIADLYISDISFSAYNPDIGDLINFTATIWNNGTADASDFYVRFYVDGSQIGDSIWINYLPHGVNMLVTSSAWQVADCGHTVVATVDEDDFISETNEYNNSTDRPIGTDLVPSLWPYYYSNYISVLVGTPIDIYSRIYNNGTFDADTVYVSYIINSTMIAFDGIPQINHAHSQPSHIIHTFNNTGDYDLLIYADMLWPDSTRFCELDETNNTVTLHVHVYGEDPDLVVHSQHISPTELNPDPGETIDIFGSFVNEGNVPASSFYVKFFANSQQLGDSIYISGLAAHEDSTVACTEQFSSNLIGTHILRLEVDVFNDVVEYDEMNNMASRAIIVGDAPDHTFSDYGAGIWLSDTFPSLGDTIVINGIVENNGGATGMADLNYYYIFMGDTTLIETVPFTSQPYDSTDFPIDWIVTVPYGRIYANITNSNPEEFNIYNNDTHINFGNELDPLIVTIDPSSALICHGESVSLTGTATGGTEQFTYSWSSVPVGFVSTNSSIVDTPAETTTYTLTVNDGFNSASASFTIQVYEVDVDLGTDQTICGSDSIILDAGVFDTYLWSTGATTQSITVTDNGYYWVSVQMLNFGCSDADTVLISISPGLDSEIASYSVCDPQAIITHHPARGSGYTYEWSNGTSADTLLLTNGGTYYSTVTDQFGCSTNDTVIFIVDTINVDLGPNQTVCNGQSVILDAGQGQYYYYWSTSETNQMINVIQSGVYSVTVTNASQCSDSDTIEIDFISALTVDLGDTIHLCPGDSTVIDAGTQYAYYMWSTQDTSHAITVDDGGIYYLTVTDQSGCTGTGQVVVDMASVVDVDIPNQNICNDPITVSTNEGYSWLWSTAETTNSISLTDEGEYSLTVTFGNGCIDLDTFDVFSIALPIDLGSDTSICEGDSIILSVPNNYTLFTWSTQDTSNSITIDDGGIYYLTIYNPDFNCPSVDSIQITMNSLPEIVWNGQLNICGDDTILLTPGIFTSYLWNNQSTNSSIEVYNPGTYSVTVTNQNGCEASSSLTVNQFANPSVDLGNDTSVCEGGSLIITAGQFDSYLWNTQETSSYIEVSQAGNFSVIVTDQNGCSASDEINISLLPISVDLGTDTFLCPGTLITLDPGVYSSYMWSTQSTDQSITISSSGTYSVTVMANNGCYASDDISVLPVQEPLINLGPDQSICEGNMTTLFGGYFSSYNWSNGSTDQTITITSQGTYSITVSDNFGCLASDTVTVNINPLPIVNIIGLNPQYCSNDDLIQLLGAPSGGNFSGPGVAQSYLNPAIINPGQVVINYAYTDTNGCSNSTTDTTIIYAAPNVSFTGLEIEYFSDDLADTLTGIPAGGIFTGAGMVGNAFNPIIAGIGPHDIMYEYTDNNGCTDVDIQSTYVTTVHNISGTVLYATQQGDIPINPVDVYLENVNQLITDTVQNDTLGQFMFTQNINGTYFLSASSVNNPNGINATDALNIRRHIVSLQLLEGLQLEAGDVNGSGTITSADALLVLRRTVGYISTFPVGEWIFDHPQVIVSNSDVIQDVYGMCYGDVNGSYIAGGAKNDKVNVLLEKSGTLSIEDNNELVVPLSMKYSTEVGAMTLVLKYPTEQYEFIGIESEIPNLLFKAQGNAIRIAFENVEGIQFNSGDILFSLNLKKISDKQHGELMLSYETEFADKLGNILYDIVLNVPSLNSEENSKEFSLGNNYPNPFKETTTISFNLPEDAFVRLVVQDILGQDIEVLINDNRAAGDYEEEFSASKLASGVYIYKIEVKGKSNDYTSSRIMQIIK